MKFKKEYRWLLFLLVPFVVFMLFLLMIPLQFILNAQPLISLSYNLQKSKDEQIPLRSSVKILSEKIQFRLQKYNFLLNLMDSIKLVNNFIKVTVNMSRINNAYQFYISSNKSNLVQMQSMYFYDKSLINPENAGLKQIFGQYYDRQTYIKNYIDISQQNSLSLVGMQNFYQVNSSLVMFYYPSFRDNLYSQVNATVNSTLYTRVLDNYIQTNNTFMIFNNVQRSNFHDLLFTYCKIMFAADNKFKGVSCLDIDSNIFTTNSQSDFLYMAYNLLNMSLYFVTPEYKNISDATATFISTSPGTTGNSQILDIIKTKTTLQSKIIPIQESDFQSYRQNQHIYYLYPIYFRDYFLDQSSITAYYLVQNDLNTFGVDLQQYKTLSSTLNTLLPPTIILIVISIFISIFILHKLLNGLDSELHKLNERCKFMIDGDINIEIPDFTGTKDILQVYQQVKIINKLHRYTSKDYFVGHFSNRILKYNQALQVLKSLHYDQSHILENIGQAYLYIEQYDKSIHYLKQSIKIIETKIQQEHGSMDKILIMKAQKEKLSMSYKQKELILIRRLWKIVFTYFKYVDMQIINTKQLDQENLTEQEMAKKKQRLQRQTAQFVIKLKRAIYPDFKSFAQCVMLHCFEVKFHMTMKNFDMARDCLSRTAIITQSYSNQYDTTTKKLKQKGSRNWFFFRKNKLTGHSRANPNTMEAFYFYTKAVLLLANTQQKDVYLAFQLLCQALKKNIFSHSVNYLVINQIKKLLLGINLSLQKLQTTQLFRQSMPYKTLYTGIITKQIQPLLYRIAKSPAEVQCREYVFILDVSYYYTGQTKQHDLLAYLQQKSLFLYEKLVKKFDRLSLIQSNSQTGTETICNLTSKENNEVILKKSLLDMMSYRAAFTGKNEVIWTLEKIIARIKHLLCQKVIILFLKNIQSYLIERSYQGKAISQQKIKRKYKTKDKNSLSHISLQDFGKEIQQIMNTQGLKNCKLILMCAKNDQQGQLRSVFGLKDINKRIWNRTKGLNQYNNTVYIIDQKHKSDLDRILMSKLANVSDNHVFAL